jgi:hypothetical protein
MNQQNSGTGTAGADVDLRAIRSGDGLLFEVGWKCGLRDGGNGHRDERGNNQKNASHRFLLGCQDALVRAAEHPDIECSSDT